MLLHSGPILRAIEVWWGLVYLRRPDGQLIIDKAQYMEMNCKMQLALVPGMTKDEAYECADSDWTDDNGGKDLMDK